MIVRQGRLLRFPGADLGLLRSFCAGGIFIVDVLTWTVERRMQLRDRAELLRKELAGIEAEVARLEVAEVVFGQWAEATDGGRRPSGIVSPDPEPEPKWVVAGPGAGGMRLVPDRAEGMGAEVLPPEYRRIMEIVAGAGGPVMAKDVAIALGRDTTPAKADLGFVGLDEDPDDPVIISGRKATRNHRLTDSEKEANRLLNRERAAVEHGFANLKSWRPLTKVRMNARHATTLLRALLVLANTEVHR
ncbi:hypothetical protein ABT186_41220 [Streptomyces sp. NPDC001634]|uniref:hypothetical protein n=1 Tax=Streptomyces sp. NPDC001634 TaxID=3154390 RepID=UPI003329E616